MANKSHNKKRNTGLLYEFLVRTISRALVEGDKQQSSTALKILKKHFKQGTELYKEFRLINALLKTRVTTEAVASSILQEAKSAARSHDAKELDREKSLLIRNINHRLSADAVYDHQVNEYRMLATIQTLLNDWRSPTRDLERMAKFEDQIVQWLMSERVVEEDKDTLEESPGTSRLIMKVMMKKLNEKYAGLLSREQTRLIKSYAFATVSDDPEIIKNRLSEIKENVLKEIDQYTGMHPEDVYLNGRLKESREQIIAEDLANVNDDVVTRFMLYVKLSEELSNDDVGGSNV
jgi:hypothetical protein